MLHASILIVSLYQMGLTGAIFLKVWKPFGIYEKYHNHFKYGYHIFTWSVIAGYQIYAIAENDFAPNSVLKICFPMNWEGYGTASFIKYFVSSGTFGIYLYTLSTR